VFQAPTIEKLADLLTEGGGAQRWSSLVPLKPDGSRPPVFAVHGGAGTVLLFNDLARSLDADQPMYALQAVGLYGDEPPLASVEEQAARYIEEIKSVQPEGPYVVGGYCYGGLVALEIANRLAAAGDEVPLLVMFNATSPTYNDMYGAENQELDDAADDDRIGEGAPAGEALGSGLRRHWSAGEGGPLHRAGRVARAGGRRVRAAVRGIYSRYIRTMVFELAMKRGRTLPDSVREGIYFQLISARALHAYGPTARPFPGRILVLRGEGLYAQDDLGWSSFAGGGIESVAIPGRHSRPRASMEAPHAAFIAEHVERAIAEALAEHTPAAAS
jgi:thioesterase domain-containing protein